MKKKKPDQYAQQFRQFLIDGGGFRLGALTCFDAKIRWPIVPQRNLAETWTVDQTYEIADRRRGVVYHLLTILDLPGIHGRTSGFFCALVVGGGRVGASVVHQLPAQIFQMTSVMMSADVFPMGPPQPSQPVKSEDWVESFHDTLIVPALRHFMTQVGYPDCTLESAQKYSQRMRTPSFAGPDEWELGFDF